MKNFFTLLFLATTYFTLPAQVLFQQDFENGIAPMTLVDNDGKTPAPNVAAYSAAWTVASPAFGNGTKVAISNSWYNPPAAADDWMITPALTITDPNTILSWEAKAQDANYPDGYQVRVSKTGTALADFTDIVFSINNEVPTWQERGVSLGAYVGETIYIAFRNNSFDQFLLLVDNIQVANILDRDIAVTKFNTKRFHLLGSDVTIEAEVTNLGGQALNSFDLYWSDGVNTYSENITGLNLAYGESTVVSHATTLNLPQAKSYNLSVWADNPNGDTDGFLDNNSVTGVVSGLTYIPTKKTVGEEGTGTWCQFCPRGTDWMEYMTVNYPDAFIGIAVHNGDPMTVAEYDNGSDFSGFPSAYFDRAFELDPSDFEDFITEFQARIAPVAPGITATIDVATRELTAIATAEFVTEMENHGYRLAVVLSEDNVKGTGSGYSQVNYYSGGTDPLPGWGYNWNQLANPAPFSIMEYDHVGRALLGGYNGTDGSIPATVFAGDVVSYKYTVNNFNTAWNPFNMHAVVMVLDNNTGEILNAESTEIEVVCPSDFSVNVNVQDATVGSNNGSISASVANPNFGFGGYTFSWNTGATGANIGNLPAGDYTLTVSDKIGCKQTLNVTVNSVTNIEDIESLASFSLTPNPASSVSVLNARFNKAVDAQIAVVNSLGQIMETLKFEGTANLSHNFDLAAYADGIYLVKVVVGNQVHTERLIIAR